MDTSTTIIGLILVLFCALPFVLMAKKSAEKRKIKMQTLTNYVQKNNGSVHQYEFWNQIGIAIDTTNKMLYFSSNTQEIDSYQAFYLKDYKTCTIVKSEDNTKAINKLELQLNPFDKTKPDTFIKFYERGKSLLIANELEIIQKWETIIKEQL